MTVREGTKLPTRAHWKRDFAILLCVELVVVGGFLLWVASPGRDTPQLEIDKILLDGHGSAAFYLNNTGYVGVTIVNVTVLGPGITGLVNLPVSPGFKVPFRTSQILTVYYPTVAWMDGARYNFTLFDAQGYKYQSSGTAP